MASPSRFFVPHPCLPKRLRVRVIYTCDDMSRQHGVKFCRYSCNLLEWYFPAMIWVDMCRLKCLPKRLRVRVIYTYDDMSRQHGVKFCRYSCNLLEWYLPTMIWVDPSASSCYLLYRNVRVIYIGHRLRTSCSTEDGLCFHENSYKTTISSKTVL